MAFSYPTLQCEYQRLKVNAMLMGTDGTDAFKQLSCDRFSTSGASEAAAVSSCHRAWYGR